MRIRSRALFVALVVAILSAIAVAAASANELQAASSGVGLVIHDAGETLHDYCAVDDQGRTWLTVPGGTRYELVTSTADPAIYNPGDGAFHPFEAAEVRAALAACRFPIARLHADVFILPYPRRGGTESAAGEGLILLSPGVRPLSREQQHAEFIHELGHVVHRAMLPDSDAAEWNAYRAMRGIGDATTYCASAIHANRPHEIFAEDFRALFGDGLANYSGTIENSTIASPSHVSGLSSFMIALAGAPIVAVAAQPNPARGDVHFSREGVSAAVLDVFDVTGRRVTSLEPAVSAGAVHWTWTATASRGRAATGVFYARPRDGSGAAIRVTRLK